MSTESVDPKLIEDTKQQIRSLVGEIQALSRQQLSEKEFYGEFLTRVVSALAAMGGVVWTINETGGLDLQYQIGLHETRLTKPDNQDDLQRHGKLVHRIATTKEAALVPPHSGAGEGDDQINNTTDYLLVLAPVLVNEESKGVVEIFQRPGARPTTQRGYLQFLKQMCELAADYLKTHQLRHYSDRQALWNQLESFTRVAHSSLDPRETAFVIANEGRRLIECDRVSVAIKKGRKCIVEAVSGQDTFDKRSNVVTLLNRLSTAVVATGEEMWYSGDTTNMAPQVEEAVQAYIDESHAKNVAVLPLTREVPADTDDGEPTYETIGALIVEQIEEARAREGMIPRTTVVRDHSNTALSNALEHQNLFLMPVWRTLGKAQWVVSARTLPKTIAVLVGVVALILAMFFIPGDFELEGKGTLEPVVRSDVFAAQDGVVDELFVEHGSKVKAGQPLAQLRNIDLTLARNDVSSRLASASEQLGVVDRQLSANRTSLSTEERIRLEGERLELRQQRQSMQEELDLILAKQQQLQILAPIDGEVTTWNLKELLLHRPVKQGQVLVSVADIEQDWELEVHMPEDRLGHIEKARHEIQSDLKVTYILATSPGDEHVGKIQEVQRAAEVQGEEGNVVMVKVDIDRSELPSVRPGATVTAKVYCGSRPIGYVWFHDLLAFVQSRVLFKL